MTTIKPIEIQPVFLFRSVTHSNGNNARRVTLPANWVRYALTPSEVFIVVGDLIILASVEEKDKALKAAECLSENDLMQPLQEPTMGGIK